MWRSARWRMRCVADAAAGPAGLRGGRRSAPTASIRHSVAHHDSHQVAERLYRGQTAVEALQGQAVPVGQGLLQLADGHVHQHLVKCRQAVDADVAVGCHDAGIARAQARFTPPVAQRGLPLAAR